MLSSIALILLILLIYFDYFDLRSYSCTCAEFCSCYLFLCLLCFLAGVQVRSIHLDIRNTHLGSFVTVDFMVIDRGGPVSLSFEYKYDS